MSEHAKAMKSIKSAITRFDKAAQSYCVRGSYTPFEAIEIEMEYKHSRKLLEELIDRTLQLGSQDNKPNPSAFEPSIALLTQSNIRE